MDGLPPLRGLTRTTCPYCGVGCGVLAAPDGTVWVTDYLGYSISYIDPSNGNAVTTITEPGLLQNSSAVTVGADGTVWVLQFTGDRTTLGQIRNETDQITRSFRED